MWCKYLKKKTSKKENLNILRAKHRISLFFLQNFQIAISTSKTASSNFLKENKKVIKRVISLRLWSFQGCSLYQRLNHLKSTKCAFGFCYGVNPKNSTVTSTRVAVYIG